MKPRKVLTLLFFVVLLGVGYYSMSAAPALSDETYSYHGDTAWRTNATDARQLAAQEDKPVLVYFWTTWCTYCEDYNQKVYSSPAVRDRLDEFVLVAVNLDDDSPEASELKRRYNANYPPQHVATTPDGRTLAKLNGYAPENDFVAFLDRAQAESENARVNRTRSIGESRPNGGDARR
jgi:thiol:disulfide interchange protein